jgi:hypothetical protein
MHPRAGGAAFRPLRGSSGEAREMLGLPGARDRSNPDTTPLRRCPAPWRFGVRSSPVVHDAPRGVADAFAGPARAEAVDPARL